MFSDDEEDEASAAPPRSYANEFDDFIEEDEFSDDERRREEEAEIRTSTKARGVPQGLGTQLAGMDDEKLGEIYEVFGDGEEYDWALEVEDEAAGEGPMDVDQEDEEGGVRKGVPELKDVFEPGELKARLLTDEDNTIRVTDIPERYQLLRSVLKMDYQLSDEELAEEQSWIVDKLSGEKRFLFNSKPFLQGPFQKAILKVLEFISKESLEVPFIWQHRKDFLVHTYEESSSAQVKTEPEGADDNTDQAKPKGKTVTDRLLSENDLWRIVQLDIDFHGIIEKRRALVKMYEALGVYDSLYEEMLPKCNTLVDYQDLMDYIQFQYSSQIRDLTAEKQGKRHSRFGRFERIRSSKIYNLVKDFGLSAKDLGENIELSQRFNFSEDPAESPEGLAQQYCNKDDDNEQDDAAAITYKTPEEALEEAQHMLTEEIFYNVKVRRSVRNAFWNDAKVDIVLTEKGHKKIDDSSPYNDFKYAINRTFDELRLRPELYLRMLQAEAEGLVMVRVSYPEYKTTLFEQMLRFFLSDNVSDIATAWNERRRVVFKNASRKFIPLITRNIKEDLKQDSLRSLYFEVRKMFGEKLNQAPYKPPGYVAGTTARVLAISAGMGQFGRDAVLAVVVDEDGQVIENAKLGDPRDAAFAQQLTEIIKDKTPDVIGMAGFTVNSKKLFDILKEIVDREKLTPGGDAGDKLLEVTWVQDEVARLYQNSNRAVSEFGENAPISRYCIALARYLQSPLLEYAALGSEVSAIQIHPYQYLLPSDMFQSAIETAFVDYVNLVGVDINDAVRDSYVANLVPFVCGLGPRKASGILQGIQSRGGYISNRTELITEQITTKTVFMNCASFFKVPYDKDSIISEDTEPLDATRVHPEDYELGRKMAADALELDEEDLVGDESSGGVVAQLMNEDPEKLNDLILEEYADELEKKFNQKKRETLEMIKQELLNHYGEQRAPLRPLTDLQVFTMLTGETKSTLHVGVVVSASVRKITGGVAMSRLPSGVEGTIPLSSPEGRMFLQSNQTVQAVVRDMNYGQLRCELSIRQADIDHALDQSKRRTFDRKKWDYEAEERDKAKVAQKQAEELRARRIIKHPLFHVMNSRQAEEYLAGQQRGDLVIRPSSRGYDHIAITWKVGDMMYQHLDVLEIGKENEYAVGKVLQVDGYRYSDLDELIIMHVQAMANKVYEMVNSEKFRDGAISEVERWINTFTEANNGRSTYVYCYDHRHAGWFYLCFKTNAKSPMQSWRVKVIPNGYLMGGNQYGDVTELSNGFKMTFKNLQQNQATTRRPYNGGPGGPANRYPAAVAGGARPPPPAPGYGYGAGFRR